MFVVWTVVVGFELERGRRCARIGGQGRGGRARGTENRRAFGEGVRWGGGEAGGVGDGEGAEEREGAPHGWWMGRWGERCSGRVSWCD